MSPGLIWTRRGDIVRFEVGRFFCSHFVSEELVMTTMSSVPARAKGDKNKKPAELPVKIRQTRMLINGIWQNSVSGRTFETINPANGEVIAKVAEGDKADVNKSVIAARQAFET